MVATTPISETAGHPAARCTAHCRLSSSTSIFFKQHAIVHHQIKLRVKTYVVVDGGGGDTEPPSSSLSSPLGWLMHSRHGRRALPSAVTSGAALPPSPLEEKQTKRQFEENNTPGRTVLSFHPCRGRWRHRPSPLGAGRSYVSQTYVVVETTNINRDRSGSDSVCRRPSIAKLDASPSPLGLFYAFHVMRQFRPAITSGGSTSG